MFAVLLLLYGSFGGSACLVLHLLAVISVAWFVLLLSHCLFDLVSIDCLSAISICLSCSLCLSSLASVLLVLSSWLLSTLPGCSMIDTASCNCLVNADLCVFIISTLYCFHPSCCRLRGSQLSLCHSTKCWYMWLFSPPALKSPTCSLCLSNKLLLDSPM